ncbi:MAG: cupin domain-containing protein [Verrucomicrobiales bacterium]|nr:cupin domain-containing protein [Verrucomicrobiales bacterium]
MSQPAHLIHLGPAEGQSFSAVGDVYRILASGDQTGGSHVLVEAKVPPGGGPPPHIHHREDESFYVVEGEITFQIDGKRVVAGPGSFLQGPRGIPHAFRNETAKPARMLILVVPPGFDKFIEEFAHPLASFDSPAVPVSPEEIAKLAAAAPKYGIELLPPPQN